jgi:MFS family permease
VASGALAVVGVALAGVGWAVVFPALVAWLSERVPDAERGAAVGTAVAFMDIGQGSGGYLVGAVADLAGFGWAYVVPAALAVAGTVVLVGVVTPGARLRRPLSP